MSEYSIESSQNTPRDVPAFPTNGPDNGVYGAGISMRDYFAAKALAALIAEPQRGEGCTSTLSQVYGGNVSIGMDIEHVFAKVSYAMADAMLAARERT